MMPEKPWPVTADDRKSLHPTGGSTVEAADRTGGEEAWERLAEDEFICPACCCGVYIEIIEIEE